MLPPSPLTDPDVQISRIRFLTGELRWGGVAVDDPGPGEWIAFEECVESVPREPFPACSPFQPSPPCLLDLMAVPVELSNVPRDAVVGHVAYHLIEQLVVLVVQRPVAGFPTPVLEGDQRAGKAALRRRLPHHVLASLGLHPGVGEAEKVERWFLAVRMRPTATVGAEVHEARLVGVDR